MPRLVYYRPPIRLLLAIEPGGVQISVQRDNAESAPSFRERVYALVRQIPEGRVTTYGTIAHALGSPRSARMVGWAMSTCPDDVSEIAHRVVNRDGELSGGWAWGHPEIMRGMLEDEGVTFLGEYRVDLARHFWEPGDNDPVLYSGRTRKE